MNKYAQFSKASSPRGYGYTAKQSFYDTSKEKDLPVHKSTTTKKGLKMYSDKEVAANSSEVTVKTIIPKRISWEQFKVLSDKEQDKYLESIKERYPTIPNTHLAMMFGVSSSTLCNHLRRFKGKYAKNVRHTVLNADLVRFNREMMKGIIPLGDTPQTVVEVPSASLEIKEKPVVKGFIQSAHLKCDALDLPLVIEQLGFVGTVEVDIYKPSRKEQDTDGSI